LWKIEPHKNIFDFTATLETLCFGGSLIFFGSEQRHLACIVVVYFVWVKIWIYWHDLHCINLLFQLSYVLCARLASPTTNVSVSMAWTIIMFLPTSFEFIFFIHVNINNCSIFEFLHWGCEMLNYILIAFLYEIAWIEFLIRLNGSFL